MADQDSIRDFVNERFNRTDPLSKQTRDSESPRAMVDQPQDVVLEHVRAIRAEMTDLARDMGELKATQAAMLRVLADHLTAQLRIEQRLDRIETCLDLVERARS